MGSLGNESPSSVIYKDDPKYEEARVGRVFNHRRPDRYPRAVVEATSVKDIVDAVLLARELNTRVSVRSGGHSWAAWSVREDAVLIDLGKFKRLEYNEEKSTVIVSPSTTGRILNTFLATKGKLFAGGHCADVGLGGFLLQGGMGWNCKNWGWACEKIIAIEVVTAEGKVLTCNKEENRCLYWAARGAGPGFPGIITAFHLEIRDAYTNMMSSTFQWPISKFKEVMDWVVKIAPQCDESVEVVSVGLRPDPTKEAVILAGFLSFQNSEEAARNSLALVNETRPPGAIMEAICSPTSLANEYCMQDIANPHGHRYTSENAYIENDADVSEILEEAFTTMPENTKTFALYFAMSPCSRRELNGMALSMQSDHYFALYTVWEDPKDDARCQSWVKRVMNGVEKHSVGAYLGDSDFQVRRTKFWGDSQARKLMHVRRDYDPEGVICGYLDDGDKSGVAGLDNVFEWQQRSDDIVGKL